MARTLATLHALSVRFLAKTNGTALNDIVFLTPTVGMENKGLQICTYTTHTYMYNYTCRCIF